jgi:hypothetical protein
VRFHHSDEFLARHLRKKKEQAKERKRVLDLFFSFDWIDFVGIMEVRELPKD